MKNKIIASVMAVTMVFGAAGIVLPENNVFGTQLTASALETKQGTCGENLEWKLENGALTITGSGEMTTKGFSTHMNVIKSVNIDGAENILPESFYIL